MSEEKVTDLAEKQPEKQEVVLPPDHPLYGVFGVWKDKPEMVERVFDEIARYRRKIAREEARGCKV